MASMEEDHKNYVSMSCHVVGMTHEAAKYVETALLDLQNLSKKVDHIP